jgi:PleD family two-component response regulator
MATLPMLLSWMATASAVIAALALWRHAATLRRELVQLKLESRGLQRAAVNDPVTGLGSRDRLDEDCGRLVARHKRWGETFSLLLIEVWDESQPDAALRPAVLAGIARTLQDSARIVDHLYRLDARTFVGLLAECNLDGARICAGRVRDLLGSALLANGEGTTGLDVVCGVAEWSPDIHSVQQLLEKADADDEADRLNMDRKHARLGHPEAA